jgi:AcrR family transcriptional regulator
MQISRQESKQESKKAISNRARTQATRAVLLEAARRLFVEKGYADTGTPEIVAMAGVTRGALYHHFSDKLELFRAVVEGEEEAVAEQIASESMESDTALEAMLDGADAYFEAMSVPGRARLLLLEGPSILGVTAMAEIDRRTGENELRQGLELVFQGEDSRSMPHGALSAVLSAAFDKAALAVASGESLEEYRAALRILLTGIPGMKSKKS